ncbi:MAG: hypothetical protein JSR98_19095 [Proteobacteria bacterium]|nr:hypothetical protein [Pseudomonadota bacterium]
MDEMTSVRTVDWTPLDLSAPEPVKAGDLVSADAGGLPIYTVMALEEGRAWVAAAKGAPARAVPLSQFRWRASDVAA